MSSKIDSQDLIFLLKNLSIELGRTPTRDEFIKNIKAGKQKVDSLFGSYTELILAAGLDFPRTKKITSEIFNVNIVKHIEKHENRIQKLPTIVLPNPDWASISDIHFPFYKKKVVDSFIEFVGDTKKEFIILNGDAWDMYSHTKFARSHNIFTPKEEENLARSMNEEFWKRVKKASPNSKCYQLMGNHDLRPMKRVLDQYPEAEDWLKERLVKMFTFDGVTTIYDAREELYLNDYTMVFHGFRSKLGDHRDYTLCNTINGHSHVGGVVYRQIRGVTLWECNSGYAGDPEAKGLTYTPQKYTHWTPGFASGDKYGARFISIN